MRRWRAAGMSSCREELLRNKAAQQGMICYARIVSAVTRSTLIMKLDLGGWPKGQDN
jgi:hypothetical protein